MPGFRDQPAGPTEGVPVELGDRRHPMWSSCDLFTRWCDRQHIIRMHETTDGDYPTTRYHRFEHGLCEWAKLQRDHPGPVGWWKQTTALEALNIDAGDIYERPRARAELKAPTAPVHPSPPGRPSWAKPQRPT